MIMSILSGNLAEGTQKTEPPAAKMPPVASKALTASSRICEEDEAVSQKDPGDKVHIFLKFNFTMESFIIDLYTGAAKTVTYKLLF